MIPDMLNVCVFRFLKVFHSTWQFQDDYLLDGYDLDISKIVKFSLKIDSNYNMLHTDVIVGKTQKYSIGGFG